VPIGRRRFIAAEAIAAFVAAASTTRGLAGAGDRRARRTPRAIASVAPARDRGGAKSACASSAC